MGTVFERVVVFSNDIGFGHHCMQHCQLTRAHHAPRGQGSFGATQHNANCSARGGGGGGGRSSRFRPRRYTSGHHELVQLCCSHCRMAVWKATSPKVRTSYVMRCSDSLRGTGATLLVYSCIVSMADGNDGWMISQSHASEAPPYLLMSYSHSLFLRQTGQLQVTL